MTTAPILTRLDSNVCVITLNKPEKLNAWDRPMRTQLLTALQQCEADPDIKAIVLTGAGDRAFCAGQDLSETKTFDGNDGAAWIAEWDQLYSCIRSLTKPFIAALNGVAAGSAFQLSLLTDIRVGHPGVRMGQPEINSGIASTLGPWIMREMLGLSRTIELTLTGRMMNADECQRIGLIHHLVAAEDVLPTAVATARQLAGKPPIAMRLNKQRFQEITEPGFRDALRAGIAMQQESYASGEPSRMMEEFFRVRRARKSGN
ncbi:enoyl-CoA hydratase/isomerase family protein [Castellaniella sp. GW247-6E4]|uniref:enoyl-CoA hydratase/isomerase family protein n=1 Tax=Castellaniella sp. GW247-6E4 TaxID=3140380 RepID=UPI0033149C91